MFILSEMEVIMMDRMLISNEITNTAKKIKTCSPGSPATPDIIIGSIPKVTIISNRLTIEIIKEILATLITNSI